MSDIDFDELDRAVASVLKTPEDKTSAPKPSKNGPQPIKVNTGPLKPALSPQSVPKLQVPKQHALDAQALHPVAQKPVQRGRFLDMVHPSHDMAPRPTVQVGERPERTGAAAPATAAANQTFVSDVVSSEDPTKATEVVAKGPFPTHETPEPEAAASVAEAPQDDEPADFFAADPQEDPAKLTDAAPSPFIPDAKVEKRPLGAFSGADDVDGADLPVGDALHDELVAVESEDNIIDPGTPAVPVSVAPPTPVASPFNAVNDSKEDGPNLVERILHHDSGVSTARTEPAVGRSKSTLILWTVGLIVIVIGAVVGATLYLFVLPR